MKITDKRTPITATKIKDVSPGQIIQIAGEDTKYFLVNAHTTHGFSDNRTRVSNIQNGNQIDLYSDGFCTKVNAELVINS